MIGGLTMTNYKEKFNDLKSKAINFGNNAAHYISTNARKAYQWIKDNPEILTAVAVPITVSAIRSGQSMIVSHREKQKIDRAELTWYDRSTGLRWDLKRRMTNNDRLAITQMKADGVTTLDILVKLNLI